MTSTGADVCVALSSSTGSGGRFWDSVSGWRVADRPDDRGGHLLRAEAGGQPPDGRVEDSQRLPAGSRGQIESIIGSISVPSAARTGAASGP